MTFGCIDAAARIEICAGQIVNEVRELNYQLGQVALSGCLSTQESADLMLAVRALAKAVGNIDVFNAKVEPFLVRAAKERTVAGLEATFDEPPF